MTPNIPNTLGAKLGPRIAQLVNQATIDAHVKTQGIRVKGGMALQDAFFRLVASEVQGTVGQLSRRLADDPEMPPWLKDTLNFMGRESGQWAALLSFGVYGSGLSTSIGGLVGNEMAPVIQKGFAADPNAVHAPSTLAALVASRGISHASGQSEAKKSALSPSRFDQLVYLSEQLPDIGLLTEMYRRGSINKSTAEAVLRKHGYRDEFISRIPALASEPLSGAELANLVDRGEVTENYAESRAQQVGYNAADFRYLVKLVGVPPATELLLAAYRRGIISKERLEKGIRQSPLRSEWIDVISELQYDPISTVQAADAVSQNLLSRTDGRKYARQNGTRADDFDLLVESAGRPPGIDLMLEMWNRGEVTEAEVRQALLESPVKNKWVPLIMKTRRRIPPQDTVRMLINRGVISAKEGVKRFMAVGYSAEDAAAFAELAQADKTENDRNLTKSEIVSLYEFRLVNESQAKKMLDDLGYDRDEQGFILALADFRKSKRELDAAASVVRSKYVAHKISDQECSTILDSLHMPADARDHLMSLWALERDANQRELTPAQIIAAHADGFIDRANCQARLVEQGYSAGDANLLISHKMGPNS